MNIEGEINALTSRFVTDLWALFKRVNAEGGDIVSDDEADVNDSRMPEVVPQTTLDGPGLWIALRYANGMIHITRPTAIESAMKAARFAPVATYGPFQAESIEKAQQEATAKFGEVLK